MSSDNPLFDIKTGEARIRRICIDCADIRCCCRHDDENDENEEEEQELYSNDKVGADVASFLHLSLKRTETDNPRLPVQRVLLVK